MKLFFSALILIAVSQHCFSNNDISEIRELIRKDQKQALQLAEEIWNKNPKTEEFENGLLYIDTLIANKRFTDSANLLSTLLNSTDLSLTQKALIFSRKWVLARKQSPSSDTSDLLSQSKEFLEQLNKESASSETKRALFELNEAIGLKLFYEGEYKDAESFIKSELKYADVSNPDMISNINNTLGALKAQQGEYAESTKYIIEAINIREKAGLSVDYIQYLNLGALFINMQEWEKSIKYSKKALESQKSINKGTASIYSNLAGAYTETGEYDKAKESITKSIDISEKLHTSTAGARNNLANILVRTKEYPEAMEQINLSIKEYEKLQSYENLAISFKTRGDIYTAMGIPGKAGDSYEESYQLYLKHELKPKMMELYPKYIDNLEVQGKTDKALKLMKEFKKMNDEVVNVESNKQYNEILSKFEVEKKERALADSELQREKQSKEIALLENQTRFERKILILIFSLLAGLILILLLIFRSWKFRGKVNKILLEKNIRIQTQHNELNELNEKLKNQAEIDTLTQLKNRRYITRFISEQISKSDIYKDKKLYLIIIDIDDFKEVNDLYGHQVGDEVLMQFSKCLKQTKGKSDILARWGGEEFLWLMESNSQSEVTRQCENFQKKLKEQIWPNTQIKQMTCSIGFSPFPLISLNFEDWEASLRLADYALYQSKKSGKDQWYGFEILDQKINYNEVHNPDVLLSSKRIKIHRKE